METTKIQIFNVLSAQDVDSLTALILSENSIKPYSE